MLLLAAVSFLLDPISSLELTGHVLTNVTCPGECRVVTASLQHVDGAYAVSAHGERCGDSVTLEHVPFGARLTPRVTFYCDGALRWETGPPVTIAPYLTNVEIADEGTIWVPARAAPHGDERIRLRVRSADGGWERVEDFSGRELVMRNAPVPWGTITVSATLEPYGVASNTRTVHREEPSARFTATGVGCAAVTPVLIPLLLFRRRRFPFPRGFC